MNEGVTNDVKSSKPKSFRPGPHAMLVSFSRKMSSWPRCQSSKSRHYVTPYSRNLCLWTVMTA